MLGENFYVLVCQGTICGSLRRINGSQVPILQVDLLFWSQICKSCRNEMQSHARSIHCIAIWIFLLCKTAIFNGNVFTVKTSLYFNTSLAKPRVSLGWKKKKGWALFCNKNKWQSSLQHKYIAWWDQFCSSLSNITLSFLIHSSSINFDSLCV